MKLRLHFLLLAALAWMAVSVSDALAEVPGVPQNLTAGWQWSYIDNGGIWVPAVSLQWFGNSEGGKPTGFRIYHSPGEKTDYEGFELMEDMGRPITDSTGQDGMWRMVLGRWMSAGSHSFYVESVNSDGSSGPGNIAVVNVPDSTSLSIDDYPGLYGRPAIATIGEEFLYQVGTRTTSDLPLHYSLIPYGTDLPEGLVIDESTGVITWTPTEAGDYHFVINVWLEGMPQIQVHAYSYIRVLSCSNAIISGLVKDEDGNPVSSGYVLALPVSARDTIRYQPEGVAIGSDGTYELHLDAGSYYLYFEGDDFLSEYYMDASGLDDAEVVEAVCGQTLTADATVYRPTRHTVSGHVADYEGNPIRAHIIFEGYDLNYPSDIRRNYPRQFSAYAGTNGEYSIRLEGGYEYIAFAQLVDTFDTAGGRLVQALQFFDHVEDYTEAEVFVLTGDRDNVNFDFPQLQGFENSLSGRVEDTNGQPLEAYVVINRVKGNSNTAADWFSMSTMTNLNSNGEYHFQDLLPGQYIVVAYPMHRGEMIPGYYNENGPAVLSWTEATRVVIGAQTDETGIDIVLGTTDSSSFGDGSLRGSVYGNGEGIGKSDGEVMGDIGISGAFVSLTDSKGVVNRYNLSGSNGAFSLNELAEGTYTLLIDKIGFVPYTTTVEISGSEPVQIEATLQPEATTGVGETSDASPVRIYPNPAAHGATLTFDAAAGTAQVSVVSVTGTEVLSFRTTTVEGRNALYINTQALATGTYFVRVTTDKGVYRLPMRVVR